MLAYVAHEMEVWQLSAEGQGIAANGSHEVAVFEAIPAGPEGIALADLQVRVFLNFFLV